MVRLNPPAVGGVRINYTHIFISRMVLKTGLAGLLLRCCLYFWILCHAGAALATRYGLFMTLAAPLMIDSVLYASYKWLDFGLLLLVIYGAASCINSPAIVFKRDHAQTFRHLH